MKWFLAAALAVVLHAATALAQSPPSAPSGGAEAAASAKPAPVAQIDPEKLPVSIGRIRLQLKIAPPSKSSGLRIQETIEVVGVAPKLELWSPETAKLATGPVPYGAPTHKEFMDLVTPQDFKTYPFDMNALIQWLLEHVGEKKTTE